MDEVVLNEAQLKCLASPACNSVLQALRALRQASATEIARSVGRSPATVHYHLKCLLDCSLIREAFHRPTARKPEAVYEMAASSLKLPDVEPGSAEGALARRAVVAGLRQVMRGYERAAQSSGRDDSILHVIRAQIRLRPDDADKFIAMLEAASRFAAEHRTEEGALLHWSSVVYPEQGSV